MINKVAELLEAFKKEEDRKLHESGITHPTTIGDMYEGLTAAMQSRTLPCGGLSVVSGFAKDHKGKMSKQLDCMLVVGEGEALPYNDKRVYLLDDIIAVTEVKKTLYTDKLTEAHDNLRSLMDLKPSRGRRIKATVHRAFQDLTESPLPDDVSTLPPTLLSIYHILVVEAGWPTRILLGFRGFANEKTFRQGIIDYLTAKTGVQGYGPMSMPSFIIGPNAAAIKNVSMPWGTPIDSDGTWPLIQTNGFLKPAYVLLEAIWSRLSCLGFIDDSVFGEDLQVEEWNRLLDCRLVPDKGWDYHAWSAEVAAYGESSVKEWSPIFVDDQAYAIAAVLCKNKQFLNLDTLEGDAGLQQAAEVLRQTRIIGPEISNPRVMRIILQSPVCVRLPDGRLAIGENNSGRMMRWLEKHFPDKAIAGSWNESGGRTTGTPSPPGCRRLRRWRGKILCGEGFGPEPPADASPPPGHRPPFSFHEPTLNPLAGIGIVGSERCLRCAVVHQPGVNVTEHLAVQAMGRGIGLEGHPQAAGTQCCHVPSGTREWMLGIPGSMNNEKGQVATGLHASQRSEAGRQPTVHGDHAGEALGIAETEAVGDRCSFSTADEEDPFRMDV